MEDKKISYGGQAVMEGVMMRGRAGYSLAVRKPDGDITIIEKKLSPPSRIMKWPIIRGIVAFGSSMKLAFSVLSQSAEIAMEGLEPEPTSRVERFLTEKLGDKLNNVIVGISMVLAVVLGLGMFMLLPALIGSFLIRTEGSRWLSVVEGLVRICIFVLYVFTISRMRDIQRVFQYHGAEHMAIDCHEQGLPLTPENVSRHSRLHKRCGTSFLLVVMVVSMVLFMIVRIDDMWLRLASRIIFLPLIAGLSYEISVKWAGGRDNWLVRAVIAPGILMQRMTTKVPDTSQIEVAIAALEKAIAQDAPHEQDPLQECSL